MSWNLNLIYIWNKYFVCIYRSEWTSEWNINETGSWNVLFWIVVTISVVITTQIVRGN
jgi:hypothetical protein